MELEDVLRLIGVFFLFAGVRKVPHHERLVVFRLNRYLDIRGPGTVWVFPFIDKSARVKLDEQIPHWRSLTGTQLTTEIERLVRASGYHVRT